MPRDLSHFQDRQEAIRAFDQLWSHDSPWILAFNGVSGLGKSTLLDWLEVNRCVPRSMRYASLSVGDFISNLSEFLARIIEAGGARLSAFAIQEFSNARLSVLDELNQRILQIQQSQVSERSPDSQQTMSANVAEAVRAMQSQADSVIVEHWLRCLRTLPASDPFVLLLDNYDVYQDLVSLSEIRIFWNVLERARAFLPNFRVVLACREKVRHQEHVDALRRGLLGEELSDLSKSDSETLLNSLGVSDHEFCDAVYRLANGHPLITRMAAEAWNETPGGLLVKDVPKLSGREQVVEWLQVYIMNRMEEPLRSAARWLMVLRWFSFEILNAVLLSPITEADYQKIANYSFIVPSKLVEGYKAGHDLVRKVQIAYLRREQPANFLEFHRRAADYFETMEGAGLEKLYHQFFIAADDAFNLWKEWESQAAFQFQHQAWGLLFELALRDELSLSQAMHAEILYRAGRRHYYRAEWFLADEFYNEALKLFKEIGDRLGEANVRKAIGDVQQFRKETEAALASYNEALKLFKEIGDRLGEANVQAALCRLALVSGDLETAEKQLESVIAMRRQIGDIYSEGADYGNFSIALLNLGNKTKAKEYAIKARGVFEKVGEPSILKQVDGLISACDE